MVVSISDNSGSPESMAFDTLNSPSQQKLFLLTHYFPWIIEKKNINSPEQDAEEYVHEVLDQESGEMYVIRKNPKDLSLLAGIPLNRFQRSIYVGCVVIEHVSESFKKEVVDFMFGSMDAIPVFVSPNISAGHESYCANNIRPLFHYTIWAKTPSYHRENENWDCYHKLNMAYLDPVCMFGCSEDYVWIQDYHLFLLPALFHEKRFPNIGFYLPSIFPSTEVFRCLPRRKEILEGILGSCLIGFQNYSYSRHFISSCTRILGLESSPTGISYQGRSISVEIFPTGVHVDRILKLKETESVRESKDLLRERFRDKKIIIGRDKSTHIKGVLYKLIAFERFLETNPEWVSNVILIQIVNHNMYEDQKTEIKVWEAVTRINGKYGSLEYSPIHYYNQRLEQSHYLALLCLADVLLVTSERDAMNNTVNEFVLCQEEKKSPVIISELVANAESLGAAVMINPWDGQGISNALRECLLMNESEKRIRHDQLFRIVSQFSREYWAKSYIEELVRVCRSLPRHANPSMLNLAKMIRQFKNSTRRLIILDYDGTLVPIKNSPEQAVPSSQLIRLLNVLCRNVDTTVFILSGRDREFLDKWFGSIANLGLGAEHGCFVRFPGEEWESQVNLNEAETWKSELLPIFEYYTERTPRSVIEKKTATITWHYRQADPVFGSRQAKELQNHLESQLLSKLPVEVIVGKKNLEVRPISINKGEMVRRLVNRYGDCDFVLCIGDDRTDEDMFRAVDRAGVHEKGKFTCLVGSAKRATAAQFHILSPDEVVKILGLVSTTGSSVEHVK